jgi:hypothetical protein
MRRLTRGRTMGSGKILDSLGDHRWHRTKDFTIRTANLRKAREQGCTIWALPYSFAPSKPTRLQQVYCCSAVGKSVHGRQ